MAAGARTSARTGDVCRSTGASPAASYVSSVTVPCDSKPRLPPVWTPNGDDERDVDRVELRSGRRRSGPTPRRRCSRACISVEPVAVVDGGQEARVLAEQRLVLDLEVLGEGHQDLLAMRRRDRRGPSPGRPGRRDRRAACPGRPGVRHAVEQLARVGRDDPAGRRPRGDDARPRATRTATTSEPDAGRTARRDAGASRPAAERQPAGEAAELVGGRARLRAAPGRAAGARRRARRGPPAAPTFVPNSLVWGAISSVLAIADEEAERRPARPARRAPSWGR